MDREVALEDEVAAVLDLRDGVKARQVASAKANKASDLNTAVDRPRCGSAQELGRRGHRVSHRLVAELNAGRFTTVSIRFLNGYFETEHSEQIVSELKLEIKAGKLVALSGIVGCSSSNCLKRSSSARSTSRT
jgi:hypothetical protein